MSGAAGPELAEPQVAVYRLDLDDTSSRSPEPLGVGDREWIEPILQENAVWFCRLRWSVVTALALAGLISLLPGGLGLLQFAGSPVWPLAAAGVLAVLNLAFISLASADHAGRPLPVRGLLWAQIVSDLLVLTAVIHWLGPSLPAAQFMYLFHIILASIVFSRWESLAVAALAASFYLSSLFLESAGLLARSTVPDAGSAPAASLAAPSLVSVLFPLLIWSVIWSLSSKLAAALRSRERELFISNRRLAASVEERSRHMLETTHQLKAPFAAIHAQAQLLLGEYCGALPEAARGTVQKISSRCLVVARQIQEMLQLANLRSQGQTAPRKRPVDLAILIEEILARVEPAARQRGVQFEREIHSLVANGVEDHLTMLIDNLVVNAVNYSYENGVVNVACFEQQPEGILVSVRDRGIGIPKEKLPRIFEDYYRTEEAVRHNRGSTGLGLAIVRQVACKDRMPITVESAPGWGTRFTVTLAGASSSLASNSSIAHN